MKILDVGCGIHKYIGRAGDEVIGIDFAKETDSNVIWDLDSYPYPFGDNTFDFIYCHHIIEHLKDTVKTMEELHRIASPNAIIEIHVPHYIHMSAWKDITHRRAFSFDSFHNLEHINHDSYTEKRFKITERRFSFAGHDFQNRISNPFVKFMVKLVDYLSNKSPYFYERLWAHWIGGSSEIIFKLQVLK